MNGSERVSEERERREQAENRRVEKRVEPELGSKTPA